MQNLSCNSVLSALPEPSAGSCLLRSTLCLEGQVTIALLHLLRLLEGAEVQKLDLKLVVIVMVLPVLALLHTTISCVEGAHWQLMSSRQCASCEHDPGNKSAACACACTKGAVCLMSSRHST